MNRITISILTLVIILFSAACATKYQAKGFTGGFTETRLAEDVYRINFSGNAMISASTVADYAMLRAAELTLQSGYRFFTTPEADNTISSDVVGTDGDTYTHHKARSDLTIVMHKTKPDYDGIIYDAEYVEQSIRAKHGMTE